MNQNEAALTMRKNKAGLHKAALTMLTYPNIPLSTVVKQTK